MQGLLNGLLKDNVLDDGYVRLKVLFHSQLADEALDTCHICLRWARASHT